MKTKTTELTGAALDWAVNKCLGGRWESVDSFIAYYEDEAENGRFHYSTDWAQGGPIIEREGVSVSKDTIEGTFWFAAVRASGMRPVLGPTPLIAAMRCYVASKLGEEVDVPDELQ